MHACSQRGEEIWLKKSMAGGGCNEISSEGHFAKMF
jgi:hypothetical protein